METFKRKLVYVYDALCPWCYAFTPVVAALRDYFGDHFQYEVLSGGMYRDDRVTFIAGAAEADRLRSGYRRIEEMTGVVFGPEFYDAVAQQGRRLHSEPPAVALAALRLLTVRSAADVSELDFAHALLRRVFLHGGDPSTDEFYRAIARDVGLDAGALVATMAQDEAKNGAVYDFALARQLGADGYPRLYLQTAEDYLHLVAKGYAPFERVHGVIEKIESEA